MPRTKSTHFQFAVAGSSKDNSLLLEKYKNIQNTSEFKNCLQFVLNWPINAAVTVDVV